MVLGFYFVASWLRGSSFFSGVLLKRKKLKWADPVLKYGKRRNILPTLKRLPGMQMLNPIPCIADRAPASAEL